MSTKLLHDLDALLLEVRNKTSQSYIEEALNAYRVGAFRSAIVSTWIAVTFDVLSKIRELALNNDKNAEKFIQELDAAISKNNIGKFLDIENNLLEVAAKDFEFISNIEKQDLEELKRDRHLCAHPAFKSEDELFQPIAEKVRVHIVHAILHLLKHQPVQGKSALDRIMMDLKEPYYPTDKKKLRSYVGPKYLDKSKPAFVRNLTVVLLKVLLKGEKDFVGHDEKIINTLIVISENNPDVFNKAIEEKIDSIVATLSGNEILNLFYLIDINPGLWRKIPQPSLIAISELIKNSGVSIFDTKVVLKGLRVQDVRNIIYEKLDLIDINQAMIIVQSNPCQELAKRAIGYYGSSGSFRSAENNGEKFIVPYAKHFSALDLKRILDYILENGQISNASGTKNILEKLYDDSKGILNQTQDYWGEFVVKRTISNIGNQNSHYSYPSIRRRLIEDEYPLSDGLIPADTDGWDL